MGKKNKKKHIQDAIAHDDPTESLAILDNSGNDDVEGIDAATDVSSLDDTASLPIAIGAVISPITITSAANSDESGDDDSTGKHRIIGHTDRPGEGQAILSLHRLEEDLQGLQNTWSEIERQLADKDDDILQLMDEREVHLAAFKSLQTDLGVRNKELSSLTDELKNTEQNLAETQLLLGQHDERIAASEEKLGEARQETEKARQEREIAQADSETLRSAIEEHQARASRVDGDKEALAASLIELKVEKQELESYIDRRKQEWDALRRDLEQYKDALAGMQVTLDQKDKINKARQKEQAKLTQALQSAEKKCSELDGRRAEREQSNKELNGLVSQKADELALLRKQLEDAQVGSKAMREKVQDQQIRLHALEGEVEAVERKIAETRRVSDANLEDARSKADSQIEDLRSQLASRADEVEKHTRSIRTSEELIASMKVDLKGRDDAIDNLRQANAAFEGYLRAESAKVEELKEKLGQTNQSHSALETELAGYRIKSEERLEANAELIAELEDELERRNSAIELLNKNVAQLGRIKDNVQALDRRIMGGMKHPVHGGSGQPAKGLMIAVSGAAKIKYPLYKGAMTIGRSMDNDIQVRRKWVSRKHARIVEGPNGMLIEDLGSKNGIYVNDKHVTVCQLNDGDIVDIGEAKFRFVSAGAVVAA